MTYYLVLDTETANTLTDEFGNLDTSNALVYDIGWAIVDKQGTVYKTASYLISDIFVDEKKLMKSAYYADKISAYWRDYRFGKRRMSTFENVRLKMLEDMVNYHIDTIMAHNARFDINALNTTRRYLSKSMHRFFFPYNLMVWDTMKMAESTICKMPTYKKFCNENGYLTANGQVRKTAEILYRFIKKDNLFTEKHTGLEDVLIEKEIFVYCFSTHKKIKKCLYEEKILTPIDEEEEIIMTDDEIIVKNLIKLSIENRIKKLSNKTNNTKIIAKLNRKLRGLEEC